MHRFFARRLRHGHSAVSLIELPAATVAPKALMRPRIVPRRSLPAATKMSCVIRLRWPAIN